MTKQVRSNSIVVVKERTAESAGLTQAGKDDHHDDHRAGNNNNLSRDAGQSLWGRER